MIFVIIEQPYFYVLARVKTLLSIQIFEKVIHAFVTSSLDYCNSLYGATAIGSKCSSQAIDWHVQIPAHYSHSDHITVEYKILTLVFKALHNLAPTYLTELLQTHKSVRPLRSRFLGTLLIPRSRLKHSGDRAFAVVGPTLWNNLPVAIRTTSSLSIFKVMLKSHLLDWFAASQVSVFVFIYWDYYFNH